MAVDPCSVCGSTDLNLIDGYYYCIECGTQDKNVRETVIEQQFFADGTFAQSTKKKILINDEKIQMTGEWYKWHTYNFILNGLADELIALGAEASFKTKLLWIWTKYVKKYQKKDDIGLSQINENETSILQFTEDVAKDGIDEEDSRSDELNGKKAKKGQNNSSHNISVITSGLLISMLYAALNLDKSHVQISHLFRFMEEDRLIVSNFDRHIPEDVNVKSIPDWTKFILSCGPCRKIGIPKCRKITMTLLKKLDLGPPVVPDIRMIIDNYVTELCLPNEFKNLIFSLMYLWPCDFLDVDSRSLKSLSKIPDYEGFAIAYVVIGLKMCFGLDDDYEYRLSDVVDKLNEMEKFSKCYKIGFTPEPTGRLFSFREWITYLQFRRKMLTKNRMLNSNEEHYLDIEDYIYMEYLRERPKRNNITMTDQLSMDIVNKLNLDKDIDVIPKEYFPPTLIPLTTYTEVLSRNCRHTKDVELLSEDFTQYSLKYACESLHLSLENGGNITMGITNLGKTISDGEIMCGYLKDFKNNRYVNMVYVMNCQNKNWLKTNRPTIDHVVIDSNEKNNNDDEESDHSHDSNLPSTPIDKDVITQGDEEEGIKVLEIIKEEDDHKHIFDDAFEDTEKKEFEAHDNHNIDHVDQTEMCDYDQLNESDEGDRQSVTSTESFEFNPETFNKERAIKELILHKCKKYKIPVPKEYRTTEPRKRKRDYLDDAGDTQKKYMKTTKRGEVKGKVNKLLEAYYNHLDKDVMNHVSHQLNLIINNMNLSKQEDISHGDIENPDNGEPNFSSIHGYTNVSEISAIAPELSQNNLSHLEGGEEHLETTLFNEESDCDNIEDLTIENDPKFDESKYDVNQLYIKMDDAEPEDIYESLKDPELTKIIEKKIEECKHNKITTTAKGRDNEATDSEDEIPLSVLRAEKDACFKDTPEKFEPLITDYSIPEFKYWVRRYNTIYMTKEQNVLSKFDSEISESMPKTFSFLLRECATISGCTQFIIYKCLQNIETNLVFCARSGVE